MGEHISTHAKEQARNRRLAWGGSIAVLVLAGGGVLAGTSAYKNNNEAASALPEAARSVAANRNTCALKDMPMLLSIGKRSVLQVVAQVSEKDRPALADDARDRFAMDVSFDDQTGNLTSGLLVWHEGTGEAMLDGNSPTGHIGSTATAELSAPFLKRGTYSVYRQNAIDAQVQGALVEDRSVTEATLVPCGAFTYNPDAPFGTRVQVLDRGALPPQ